MTPFKKWIEECFPIDKYDNRMADLILAWNAAIEAAENSLARQSLSMKQGDIGRVIVADSMRIIDALKEPTE